MSMDEYDVYSYGVIAHSTVYRLGDHFPERSGYAEVMEKYQSVGGEAANSSLVLSRLGKRVKLDGNWINPDDDARFLRDVFHKNQVDTSRLTFQACQGPKEMLVVDSDSRTIFGTYGQLLKERSWNAPQQKDVQNARVLCLDPFFDETSRQAAEYARDLNRPIVTVDCKIDDPVFLAADVLIVSEEFLRDAYPDRSVQSITQAYRERSRGTVIFTFGHKEIIFGSRDKDFTKFTPFTIDPVDTTGAGDSFRAGIIFGLLEEWSIGEAVKFASALSAMVCQSVPGVLHSPSYDEVISFMKDHQ